MSNFDGVQPTYTKNNSGSFQIPKRKHRKLKWFLFFVLLLGIIGVGVGGYSLLSRASNIFTNKKNIFTRVGSLFISSDKPLIGEDQGTVNILLLGVGGEGHDGAYLTDTMIVASINTKTHEVVLTSIPRDWLEPIEGHGLNKINAVYAYGLQDHPNDPDQAGQDAIKAAEQVTGFDIPYYAEIDFKGFVKAVDHVGGLDITVYRTFSDSSFPNDFPFDTKGYLGTVTFNKGPQHMDGRTALIYARSRHGTNNEGSDFARSERQKKVLIAFKSKLSQLNITNANTLNNLLSDFTSNFKTNFEPYELLRLEKIVKDVPSDNIYSLSLEPQGDLICDSTIDQRTGLPYVHPVDDTSTQTAPATTSTTTSSTKSTATNSTTTKPSSSTSTSTKNSTATAAEPKTATTGSATTAPNTTTQTAHITPTGPQPIPMYIVEPCSGKTVADIQKFLSDYWDMARLKKEGATVEVQNSTGKPAATYAYKKLTDQGFTLTFVPFTGKVAFDRTILYDNSQGTKPKTLEFLKGRFNFTQADVQYTNSKADFVIIVGNDSLQ